MKGHTLCLGYCTHYTPHTHTHAHERPRTGTHAYARAHTPTRVHTCPPTPITAHTQHPQRTHLWGTLTASTLVCGSLRTSCFLVCKTLHGGSRIIEGQVHWITWYSRIFAKTLQWKLLQWSYQLSASEHGRNESGDILSHIGPTIVSILTTSKFTTSGKNSNNKGTGKNIRNVIEVD